MTGVSESDGLDHFISQITTAISVLINIVKVLTLKKNQFILFKLCISIIFMYYVIFIIVSIMEFYIFFSDSL